MLMGSNDCRVEQKSFVHAKYSRAEGRFSLAKSDKLMRFRTCLTGPSDESFTPNMEPATAQPTRQSNQ